jgi:basic amino acid/polyamine antiporter, APA family
VAFAAIVVVSVAGSLAAVLMAFPRVYYAMARDGLFFASFATVDPRRGAPVRAIAVQAVLAVVLALSLDSLDRIIAYFMVPTLAFLALAVAGVFALRRRASRRGEPGIVVPGYPVAPLMFLAPVVIVVLLQVMRDPMSASLGAGLVAAGLPASFLVPALRRRATPGENRSSEPASTRPDKP